MIFNDRKTYHTYDRNEVFLYMMDIILVKEKLEFIDNKEFVSNILNLTKASRFFPCST